MLSNFEKRSAAPSLSLCSGVWRGFFFLFRIYLLRFWGDYLYFFWKRKKFLQYLYLQSHVSFGFLGDVLCSSRIGFVFGDYWGWVGIVICWSHTYSGLRILGNSWQCVCVLCPRFFDSYFVGALALTIRSSLCHYETFFGIFGRCSLLRFFVRWNTVDPGSIKRWEAEA